MRATAADIARLAAGNSSKGVNLKAFGPPPAVSPDLAMILTAVEQAGYGPAENCLKSRNKRDEYGV